MIRCSAGWSDAQPMSSVLRSFYVKSVDLQNGQYLLHAMSRACGLIYTAKPRMSSKRGDV